MWLHICTGCPIGMPTHKFLFTFATLTLSSFMSLGVDVKNTNAEIMHSERMLQVTWLFLTIQNVNNIDTYLAHVLALGWLVVRRKKPLAFYLHFIKRNTIAWAPIYIWKINLPPDNISPHSRRKQVFEKNWKTLLMLTQSLKILWKIWTPLLSFYHDVNLC